MLKFTEIQETKFGKPPGDLTFVGSKIIDQPVIEVFDYNQDKIEQVQYNDLDELQKLKNSKTTTWINLDGLHDVSLIQKLGEIFDLHPLLLEDTLNTTQRPKFEEYDDYLFIVLKMLQTNKDKSELEVEHLSIVIHKNYVLTFQEGRPGDVFNPIRERLTRRTSKIRSRGTDYLGFALMDIIIDKYIHVIEQFGEKIERLEDELISSPTPEVMKEINQYKREINFLRKTIRPVRELTVLFEKSESDIIEERTIPYLKDLSDHIKHATEAIETYQIMLNDQLNIYHTGISNKVNDTLRVLTVFSVVFIPLTFIAGVYGTNFKYFPELEYRYAYPVFWSFMIVAACSMLFYFKRKNWL